MNLFEIMAQNFRVLFNEHVGRQPTDEEITKFCSKQMKPDELLKWLEGMKKTTNTQEK